MGRKCLFHVLNFEVLPTPIFTTLFFYAPHFGRDLPLIVHYDRKSILRNWVYSFKHSGILRGGHRGPENMLSDRQSGLKMSDLEPKAVLVVKLVKVSPGFTF